MLWPDEDDRRIQNWLAILSTSRAESPAPDREAQYQAHVELLDFVEGRAELWNRLRSQVQARLADDIEIDARSRLLEVAVHEPAAETRSFLVEQVTAFGAVLEAPALIARAAKQVLGANEALEGREPGTPSCTDSGATNAPVPSARKSHA